MTIQSTSKPRTQLFVITAILLGFAGNAFAADPSAIVEDISAGSSKLQPMDYLFEGDTLTLQKGENITISYLGSCAIEAISGGAAKINIGLEKSNVTGKGRVKRKFVECGGADISLTRRQSDAAAGVVVRGGKEKGGDQPEVTVYSIYPVIKLSDAAKAVTIVRTDKKETKFDLNVTGKMIDLEKKGTKLTAGGVYRATAGGKSVVFKVANSARASSRNLISRLVEL